MKNPYWASAGQRHFISLETIKDLCFELMNIFYSSKSLAEEFEYIELEEEKTLTLDNIPLLSLHQKLAFIKSSELALQLALLVRTYDDHIKGSEQRESYIHHVNKTDEGSNIGDLNGEVPSIRVACNKLIHADEVRPLYERLDRIAPKEALKNELEQDIWYLTGEIELKGKYKSQEWEASIYTQPFIEAILELISFGYPDKIVT